MASVLRGTRLQTTFRVVINSDTGHPISIRSVEELPDSLGQYKESIFAQMREEYYYASQLVLKLEDGQFVTYDFYSEQAWIDTMVEIQVQQKLEPYERLEREDAIAKEVEA